MGEFCNLGRRAHSLYKRLAPAVDEINAGAVPPEIRLETARCLSLCGAGPNLIVYPHGRILNGLDATAVDALIAALRNSDLLTE
jgi:(2Fe-2S) ferredoxin